MATTVKEPATNRGRSPAANAMVRTIALYASPQFVIFLLIGGTAAGANLLARLGFSLFLNYPVAVSLAYGVGMMVAFPLNRIFVFRNSTKSLAHNVFFFVLVNLMTFPMVLAISWILGDFILPSFVKLSSAEMIGHTIGVMTPAFSSFALHKFLTFRSVEPSVKI